MAPSHRVAKPTEKQLSTQTLQSPRKMPDTLPVAILPIHPSLALELGTAGYMPSDIVELLWLGYLTT